MTVAQAKRGSILTYFSYLYFTDIEGIIQLFAFQRSFFY